MMNEFNDDTRFRPDNQAPVVSKKRFAIFAVFLALSAVMIIGRYGYLMLSSDHRAGGNRAAISGSRGPILDRNGRILAMESRMGNITLWRPAMENAQTLAAELAPFLAQSQQEIYSRIVNSNSDFIYLRRQANDSLVREIDAAIAQGGLRGVSIQPSPGRIFPERELAAQLIGFVGNDNTGLAGVEFAFDHELAHSRPASPRGRSRHSGNQVFLTIDINVQHILETISRRLLAETQAEAIMFMAMDPRSGDILGSVSLPGFDPNDIATSNPVSRMDRPAIWAFEPGSTFKTFSLAAMLDAGAIARDTFFHCRGYYERITPSGERIRINCMGVHGWVSAREISILSCNAGAAYAARTLPAQHLHDRLRDFGFGARTGAGNPGETAGLLRPVSQWSERSSPTISMGQEIAVSALQMLKATTAIANDGVRVSPRIVSHIVTPEGEVRNFQSAPPQRILSPETSRAMRHYMMETTSSLGTGWRAYVDDLSLGVKTGTAQMIDPATGAYSATDFISNVVAILPADNPSLVLYLAIIRPQGEMLAGRIAAPPIREAAEALINYLGIPRGRNPQVVHSGTIAIPAFAPVIVNDVMPDLSGLAKRQLLPLLERNDLHIQVRGDGWVARQSPPPGTSLTSATMIVLELE
ncbi:MAG: PASTA domain-containing protein [Treponema sp.]|jgi:cell division protein FtsI (penicillin-binding protein 3)|nr:PASTA domain-containing protein [Treponema sp.]